MRRLQASKRAKRALPGSPVLFSFFFVLGGIDDHNLRPRQFCHFCLRRCVCKSWPPSSRTASSELQIPSIPTNFHLKNTRSSQVFDLSPLLWLARFPTKIDHRHKGNLIPTSLLEDLEHVSFVLVVLDVFVICIFFQLAYANGSK